VTEPSRALLRRLEERRARRAAAAAARAEFEARRRHGLKARHEAKLAHLAARDQPEPEPEEPDTPEEQQNNDAA
jgi:hypothetical protein